MKGQVFFKHGDRQRGEMLAFASLGAAGFVAILFAVSAISDLATKRDQVATALSAKSPVQAESTTATPGRGEAKVGVIDPPAQTTNAWTVCSPSAAVAIGSGSRTARPGDIWFAGHRPRSGWAADF